MLLLQCTRKVSRVFGLELQPLPDNPGETGLGVWYVNYTELFGGDFLLFVNDPTLYALPIYIQDREQQRDIGEEFRRHIFYALVADGIKEHLVREKLAEYEPTIYTKTNSRRMLGHMNDLMRSMSVYVERDVYDGSGVVNMLSIQQLLNRIPQRAIGWGYAVEAMKEGFRKA